jgi:hypothetical protein
MKKPKLRGACPYCGGKLELLHFVEAWDEKGNPCDSSWDPVCRKCGIRWEALDYTGDDWPW